MAQFIPDGLLGITRRMTASEISIYNIDCGPGGILSGRQEYYRSGKPELAAYAFQLPSCIMDDQSLYTLTIYKIDALPSADPQEIQNGGKRRRRKNTRRRR